ncbi:MULTISPECIES: type II toxin-antitoxin system VapC family toxin [unclassified Corynebacterium]|uniref:type II toxin-antitoxin system VapC family toxin n=1 Tax=unclassified Corynebacterium TaxID=2624378 RepID=UPI0021A9BDFC|nr:MULTISPECIES: type II toxin-antitoxin system VapC family toxin [unclassified Corynebacterium]MCT1451487.1 type II toxin-antitoxin system VapC family toxin [Corynebacterium sp. p3-SID1145]MCT1460506.1 type II toxin-antitoxin system VapC family toxin [Corynebacterium sp. p3-SID1140]MDN8593620.1 type II toxin-antitoxin system VapC family toxin [Corynebacterium sp. P4_F2]WKK55744.1 type II toxin-antitoxin system VapC family toxin [Corynebacterium sp. P4-C1]WKK63151.1 type II toxin-antitoxin sys
MHERGLLDTSVVLDLTAIDPNLLPNEFAICSITMAELQAGPAATADCVEQAKRISQIQRIESLIDCIPFDTQAARAYGLVYAAVVQSGRTPRRRIADLLIASSAIAENLPLFTRNPDDFKGLEELVQIVVV